MHYPVMTERQLAFRWKISLKTLRRWRLDGEGPVWHKLFQHVRYHEARLPKCIEQHLGACKLPPPSHARSPSGYAQGPAVLACRQSAPCVNCH